jgi:hypothetical protein
MSVLRTTEAPISMRNARLQLKVALEISGEPRTGEGFGSWSVATRRRFIFSIAIVCG